MMKIWPLKIIQTTFQRSKSKMMVTLMSLDNLKINFKDLMQMALWQVETQCKEKTCCIVLAPSLELVSLWDYIIQVRSLISYLKLHF
jgi:hypothetical protein